MPLVVHRTLEQDLPEIQPSILHSIRRITPLHSTHPSALAMLRAFERKTPVNIKRPVTPYVAHALLVRPGQSGA